MHSEGSTSLTGSGRGAPATHSAPVSSALASVRFGVVLCCWVAGIALLVQTIVWSLATFTDLRWQTLTAAPAEAALVVPAGASKAATPTVRTTKDAEIARQPVDPNRVVSAWDRMLLAASTVARGAGTIAILALVAFITLGAMLAAGSATSGVDKIVSAFGWAIIVVLLALPVGGAVGLPWREGALWSYDAMTAAVDARRAEGAAPAMEDDAVFHARFLILPLACLAGIAFVSMRFHVGVEAGLFVKEDLRLDRQLEQEAGNVKAGSLIGGRASSAMRTTMASGSPLPPAPKIEAPPAPKTSTVRQLTPGEAPRRLI
jgi:hypothetical protein